MVSDSIANASIPSAAFSSKDLGKKKRARTAKLKQCKLDVRREQWLSQGTAKNKSSKAEPNFTTTTTTAGTGNKENNNHRRPLGNLEIRVERVEETIGGGGGGGRGSPIHHHHHHHHPNDSDSESLSNSPTSLASGGGNDSGTNFTGSTSSRSSTSTSSSFGGFCSESITDEDDDDDDEDEDGCLDDWEAVADALAAKDEQETRFPNSPPTPDPAHGAGAGAAAVAPPGRAWRPDDASRPQNLPNLSKQLSLPNSDRHQQQHHHHHHHHYVVMMPAPSSCPICTEDLDFTDSSFLPCLCGFRLCLFCYKRIIEDDGRCPGCRKPYELNPAQGSEIGFAFRLARSCSMITRA